MATASGSGNFRVHTTVNGRLYPPGLLQAAVDEFNARVAAKGPVACSLPPPGSDQMSLREMSHVVKNIEQAADGAIQADIEVLQTPSGAMLRSLLDLGLVAASVEGCGHVDQNNRFDQFTITGVNLFPHSPPEPDVITKLAKLSEDDDDDEQVAH